MPLIAPNDATNKFNVSAANLEVISSLKDMEKSDVTTKVVLSCFQDIQKSQLGWWFSIKKFFARTFTYCAAIALPVAGIGGSVWYYADVAKNMSLANYAFWGTTLGSLLAADMAIGKLAGTRPITALLITTYDAYREGARTLAKQVTASYTDYEDQMRDLIKDHRQTIKKELLETYTGIAEALAAKEGSTSTESLTKNISSIRKTFSELGLSNTDIEQILSPLTNVIELIEKKAM